jgi:hypothetical protein
MYNLSTETCENECFGKFRKIKIKRRVAVGRVRTYALREE